MRHKKQEFPKVIIIKKRRGGLAIGILREHVPSYFDENKKKREEMERLWKATKQKLDNKHLGHPIIFGTGGNDLAGSEYFKQMWFDAKKMPKASIGMVERYRQYLKDNPPADYSKPITFEKMKEIMDKLSKR